MYIDVNYTYKPWKKYERTLIESNTLWVQGNPNDETVAAEFYATRRKLSPDPYQNGRKWGVTLNSWKPVSNEEIMRRREQRKYVG